MSEQQHDSDRGDTGSHATHTPATRRISHTRISAAWVALICGAIAVILLLVFVLENSRAAHFAFLGMHFTLPLGVAMLLAGVIGVLVTAIVGTARIHELRHTLTRSPRTKRQ